MSTEPATDTKTGRQDGSRYTVSPSVRVRKEAFGLLFYNAEVSRLIFVKSGNLLQIKALPHEAKRIVASLEPGTQSKARKLLDHLLKKGLICES